MKEFEALLQADRTIFNLMELLDGREGFVDCLLLDTVRLSISKRLERLQPKVYQLLEKRVRAGMARRGVDRP